MRVTAGSWLAETELDFRLIRLKAVITHLSLTFFLSSFWTHTHTAWKTACRKQSDVISVRLQRVNWVTEALHIQYTMKWKDTGSCACVTCILAHLHNKHPWCVSPCHRWVPERIKHRSDQITQLCGAKTVSKMNAFTKYDLQIHNLIYIHKIHFIKAKHHSWMHKYDCKFVNHILYVNFETILAPYCSENLVSCLHLWKKC